MCKIKFWACSRDHLERSDWSRNIIGSFPRAEQLYIEMNVYGTTFHHGKSILKYVKSLIIVDILSGSRNVPTECFPGSFRAIKSKYKVSGVTCFKHIDDLLSNGSGKSPSPCCS